MSENQLKKLKNMYIDTSISDMFEDHLLQSILTIVQDGICFLSKDLDVLYENPAMQFWYEQRNSSIGKKCYEAYHGRTKPCENCSSLKAIKAGQAVVEEQNYEVDQKHKGWQRIFSMPIIDKEQNTLMIIEYVRDITDEKKSVLSMELMKSQIEGLSEIVGQKEKEHREKQQLFIGNMNKSIDVVLNYLEKVLDKDSFELVNNQLSATYNGIEKRDTVQSKLTGQELVIARYIAKGYLSKEIAGKLDLSKKTIDYHRTNIRKKLNLGVEDNLKQAIIEHFTEVGIPQL